MKFKAHLIGIALCSVTYCFGQPQQKVSLSDIKMMETQERAKFLSTLTPIQLSDPKDYFNALAQGITDTDASVRQAAAGKAAYVMVGLQQRKQQGQTIPISPESFSSFQKALVGALNDPNAQIRMASAVALVYSDAPNKGIESALVGFLSNEPDFLLRISLAKEMHKAGYKSPVIDAQILEGLGNPDSQVRVEAARAAGSIKLAGALPKLALLLNDEVTASGFVVDAIAAYGSEAKLYLPQLEAMLASGSAGGTLARDLAKAIETIKSPPPQAAPTEQIKPVSLVDASSPTSPTATAAATSVPPQAPLQKQAPSPSPMPTEKDRDTTGLTVVLVAIVVAAIVGMLFFIFRRKST